MRLKKCGVMEVASLVPVSRMPARSSSERVRCFSMSASEETRFLSCHLAEFQSSDGIFSSAQNPGAEDVKEISLKSRRVYDELRDCQKCVLSLCGWLIVLCCWELRSKVCSSSGFRLGSPFAKAKEDKGEKVGKFGAQGSLLRGRFACECLSMPFIENILVVLITKMT